MALKVMLSRHAEDCGDDDEDEVGACVVVATRSRFGMAAASGWQRGVKSGVAEAAAAPFDDCAIRSRTCLSLTAWGGAIRRTARAAKIGSEFSMPNGSSKRSAR